MKKSDVYEVAIKILGLYLITYLLSSFHELLTGVEMMSSAIINFSGLGPGAENKWMVLFWSILPSVCFIIGDLFLIWLTLFRTKYIIKKICGPADLEEQVKLFAEKKDIYKMAIVIVCLLMIVLTLPDFCYKLGKYISMVQTSESMKHFDPNFIFISAIKIFIGVIGIGFSNSLAAFFAREKVK